MEGGREGGERERENGTEGRRDGVREREREGERTQTCRRQGKRAERGPWILPAGSQTGSQHHHSPDTHGLAEAAARKAATRRCACLCACVCVFICVLALPCARASELAWLCARNAHTHNITHNGKMTVRQTRTPGTVLPGFVEALSLIFSLCLPPPLSRARSCRSILSWVGVSGMAGVGAAAGWAVRLASVMWGTAAAR